MKTLFAAAFVFTVVAALPPAASADKPTYATVLCQNGAAITACPPGMPSNLKPGSVRITHTQAATIAASIAPAAGSPAGAVNVNGTANSVAFSQTSSESIAAGQKSNTSVTGRNDSTVSVTNWTVSDSVAAPVNNRSGSSVAWTRESSTSVTGATSSSSSSNSVAAGQGGSTSVVH
jgi:hypothetical protein